ncbi:MAG: copper chaperone PCu(A)C [Alphaproteobacteria bacterium]|nr:copper chaperone PCu(A)C [Alphaproteobacteria bacterium]
MKTLTFAAVAALLPIAALAHDGMHMNDAYARSTNPRTAAVFMTLENHRAVPCTLQAITTDAAERAELHTHLEEDGVMRMVKIEDGVTTPAGETRDLVRGGEHIMLLGLAKPLAEGDSLTLTLDFGDCPTETVDVVVDNQRSDDATHDAGTSHDHDHDHAHGDHAGH